MCTVMTCFVRNKQSYRVTAYTSIILGRYEESSTELISGRY